MKNQEQGNKNFNLSDPSVVNDPQPLFEDLPISGEQEEQVKGGWIKSWSVSGDTDDRPTEAASPAHYPQFSGGVKVAS